MTPRRSTSYGLAVVGVGLLLVGCSERQSGYVEVRMAPSLSAPPELLLDDKPVKPARGGSIVVKRNVGTARLAMVRRGDERFALCDLAVRKDRITTVTLTTLGGTLRCAVDTV